MKSVDQLSAEAELQYQIIEHFASLDLDDGVLFCESLKVLASEMLLANLKAGE